MIVVSWSRVTAPPIGAEPQGVRQFTEGVLHLLAVAVGDRGAGVDEVGDRAVAVAVTAQRSRQLVENVEHAGELDRSLGPVQPDGVVVLQCRAAAIGRRQLDLAVGEDRVRDGHRLRVGGHLDVLVHRELDFDVSTLGRDLGDLADRHAEHRDGVALVKPCGTVELGGDA